MRSFESGVQGKRVRVFLSDLKPRLIVVDAAFESPVRAVARNMNIEIAELRSIEQDEAGAFSFGPDASVLVSDAPMGYAKASDVALVLHTSGTTSRPKIVPLTHENLCASAANIAQSLALSPADRCLNIIPLFHIHGLVGALLPSLSAGASVVCATGYDATRFFDWLAEFEPT